MPTFVPLLTAKNFAVLAGSGITIAGAANSSVVTGDIGTFPTTTITGLGNLVLNGTNHAGDAVTQQAKLDLTAAYLNAAAQPTTSTVPTELGGTTKLPGVYDSADGTFQITGTLTLDGGGDPNAVFIFKMASTLITAASSTVVLTNGAQACNCFWQVGSSATLGASSVLRGTIMALTSITLTTSAVVLGRALARNGAVTLDTNTISVCALSAGAAGVTPVTPQALTALMSCLQCLDQSQLERYLILAWADGVGVAADPVQLSADSACLKCDSDTEILRAEVAKLLARFSVGQTFAQLRARIGCLRCLSPKARHAIILNLKVRYFNIN